MAASGDIRAGRAFVEMGVEGIDAVKAKLSQFGSALKTIGATLAISTLTNKAFGWVEGFADSTRELYLQSRQLQMTTGEVQEMRGAAKELGIEQESMAMAVRRSRMFTADLALSGQQTNETMEALGLTLADLANLSDLDRVQRLGEALQNLQNPVMAERFGRNIFGRGGGPISAVAGQLAAAREKAQSGFIIPDEVIRQGFELSQTMAAFHRAIGGIGKLLGGILAPGFTTVFKAVTGIVKQAVAWIAQNKAIVEKVAVIAAAVAGVGAAIVAAVGAATALSFVLAGIGTILVSIKAAVLILISPLSLALAAVAGVAYWLLRGSGVLDSLRDKFSGIAGTISQTLGGIVDALKAGDLALAWDVAIAGMTATWVEFKNLFEDTFGVSLNDIFGGLRIAWTETVAFLKRSWVEITTVVRGEFEAIGTIVRGVWAGFNSWFQETFGISIADLGAKIKSAFVAVVGFVSDLWESMVSLIKTKWAELSDSIKGIAQSPWVTALLAVTPGGAAIAASVAAASAAGGSQTAQQIAEQLAADRERRAADRARQLEQIERDRQAARGQINADVAAANAGDRSGDAARRLRELADQAWANRVGNEFGGMGANWLAGLVAANRGIDEFAERGGSARGTFNREAISGMAGSPIQRLEDQGRRNNDLMQRLIDLIRERLDVPRVA